MTTETITSTNPNIGLVKIRGKLYKKIQYNDSAFGEGWFDLQNVDNGEYITVPESEVYANTIKI